MKVVLPEPENTKVEEVRQNVQSRVVEGKDLPAMPTQTMVGGGDGADDAPSVVDDAIFKMLL